MGVQVKICGITSTAAADVAVRAGADFAGLILQPTSHRYLGLEAAAAVARHLRGRIRVVAVVVDPTDEFAASVVQAIAPDYLQFHGRETPARVSELSARFGIAAIKAFGVAEAADLANVAAYDDVAEMYLFDAKPPPNATASGGHGVAFDWQVLAGRRMARPWLLAGGLNPENVARAILISGAPGVDAASGVESAPGVKDPVLAAAFVDAARNAQYAGARA